MRVLIQRVSEASVTIDKIVHGSIQQGMVLLIGIATDDTEEDVTWLIAKITKLRIFNDSEGKMNLSMQDIQGEFLAISQFTLHASTKKGNRPGFTEAARPEIAVPLYEYFLKELKKSQLKVEAGVFGADMKVQLINDGPTTIWIDSKNKE
ncbi:MAG: D-aminoacyl-tRNA deacylase [Crocinitomicaceae bacterium]|nr:D-aminoacyl-tRNA deacylase [Crocinitomicaceae bacterium]